METASEVVEHYGPRIDQALTRLSAELVALRRQLHMHPELSWEEVRTTEAIAGRLSIAGLVPRLLKVGTGLVCDIGDTATEPFVVLRADIDALAMSDRTTSNHRSRVDGVAHACGHDAHTALVLGAGLALAELSADDDWTGAVRLVFEPGEENVPGGAVSIVEEGWIDGAQAVFGVHCDPKLDVGLIGLRAGAISSASDLLEIVLTGPGGHTARPQLTVDLIGVTADLVRRLPEEVRKRSANVGAANVVFGSVHSGNAANVIPARSVLTGTLRTPDVAAWGIAKRVVQDSVDAILKGTGAQAQINHIRGVPPVVNDEAEAKLMAEVGRAASGPESVVPTHQSLGGDSFAWYLQEVPGAYARLGVHDPQSEGPRRDLHSADFDLDERAITVGARLLALTALAALRRTAA